MKNIFHRLNNFLHQRVVYHGNIKWVMQRNRDNLYHMETHLRSYPFDKPLNLETIQMVNAVARADLKSFLQITKTNHFKNDLPQINYDVDCGWGEGIVEYIFNVSQKYGNQKNSEFMQMIDVIIAHCPALLEKPNFNGYSPLYRALQHGQKEMFEKMLDLGANINAHLDLSAINLAALLNYSDHDNFEFFLKKLLKKGAQINDFNKEGLCPLAQALISDREERENEPSRHGKKAQILMDYGADPQIKNLQGKTILERMSEVKNMIPVENYMWICEKTTDSKAIEKSMKIVNQNPVFTSRPEDLIKMDKALERAKLTVYLAQQKPSGEGVEDFIELSSQPENPALPRKNRYKI